METDASDYALAAILSIVNEDNEVHSVAFHSHTFTVVELNYDTHDKELLAIFEAFKIWWHYLEDPAYPIDVVTDHKNLEYFSTTKVVRIAEDRLNFSFFSLSFSIYFLFLELGLGLE